MAACICRASVICLSSAISAESCNPVAGADAPLQPIVDPTNTLVDNVNSDLNTLGQQTGLSQIVHGATDLLGTIGLGAIGTEAPSADGHTNLLTDVLNAPGLDPERRLTVRSPILALICPT